MAEPSSPQSAAELTRCTADQLLRRIADGVVSSREATQAHIQRIEQGHARLNAMVYRDFERALRDAQAADDAQAAGRRLGPLHGVPITVKECFHLAHAPTTLGLTARRDQREKTDGEAVASLRAAGAVVLGKTNVPQLMISNETANPLFGRTNNPWDPGRTPGGSTGGEAALIAAGGSPWGVGTDLGGSIRVPAHFCGLAGLKPTSGRLATTGMLPTFMGLQTFHLQAGPLARTSRDVALLLKTLTQIYAGAPEAPPLGEPEDVAIKGLRVGVMLDDGFFPPSPGVRRVVQEAADHLSDLGAIVEPFSCDAERGVSLYFGLMGADGGDELRSYARGSQWQAEFRRMMRLGRLPGWTRPPLAGVLRLFGRGRDALLLSAAGRRTEDQLRVLRQQAQEYIDPLRQTLESRLACWIGPPFATPAFQHGAGFDLLAAGSYAYLPNLLDCPSGVAPAGRVRDDEQTRPGPLGDRSDKRAGLVDAGSAGLPLGVQVTAGPWREDRVLAVMMALEAKFRQRSEFPQPPA